MYKDPFHILFERLIKISEKYTIPAYIPVGLITNQTVQYVADALEKDPDWTHKKAMSELARVLTGTVYVSLGDTEEIDDKTLLGFENISMLMVYPDHLEKVEVEAGYLSAHGNKQFYVPKDWDEEFKKY
jgi:hypothetical protein